MELVKKPAAVVTSEQPFFDLGADSSMMLVTQSAEVSTGPSPVQATMDVTATQPVEDPSTRVESAANMTATQPVEAPGARTDVFAQPTGTGSEDVGAVNLSLTGKRTVAATTGVCDTEDELDSERESLAVVSDREVLSDRDPAKDHELDQELSEEANYRETMRGVSFFMGWHQIPDFNILSSSLEDNPFAGS